MTTSPSPSALTPEEFDQLKEKIVEAVPCPPDFWFCGKCRTETKMKRDLGLEDALSAVSESNHHLRDDYEPPEKGMHPWSLCHRIVDLWAFGISLDSQSDECKRFLFSLLCV